MNLEVKSTLFRLCTAVFLLCCSSNPAFATTVFDAPPGAWLLTMPIWRIEFVLFVLVLNFLFLPTCNIKQPVRKLYVSIFLTWSAYIVTVVCFFWLLSCCSIVSGHWLADLMGREVTVWLLSVFSLQFSMFTGALVCSFFIREDDGLKMSTKRRLLLSSGPSALVSTVCLFLVRSDLQYWHSMFYHSLDSNMLLEAIFAMTTILSAIGLCLCRRRSAMVTK
jgi:hypothetical protein